MTASKRRAPTITQEIRSLRAWVIRATTAVVACQDRCQAIDRKLDLLHAELSKAVSELRGLSQPRAHKPQFGKPGEVVWHGPEIPILAPSDVVKGFEWEE
jgi:hypothetical protein